MQANCSSWNTPSNKDKPYFSNPRLDDCESKKGLMEIFPAFTVGNSTIV